MFLIMLDSWEASYVRTIHLIATNWIYTYTVLLYESKESCQNKLCRRGSLLFCDQLEWYERPGTWEKQLRLAENWVKPHETGIRTESDSFSLGVTLCAWVWQPGRLAEYLVIPVASGHHEDAVRLTFPIQQVPTLLHHTVSDG